MLNLYNANGQDKNLTTPDPSTVDLAKNKQGKSKTPAFEKYVDPTGEMPTSEFKWAIWYVKHKILLYKMLVGVLIGFSVLTGFYSVWQWGDYFIFGITEDRVLEKNFASQINYTGINQGLAAIPLQVSGTQILVSGVNRYDIVTEVANPNPRFLVKFDYNCFLGEGASTTVQHTLMLPGEARPLGCLGYTENVPGDGTNLVISNVVWERIDAHQAPNIEEWQKEHLNFVVNNFSFTAYRSAEGANAHVIKYNLTNDSIFGYKEPYFYVGLFNNNSLVGMLPWRLDNLRAGQTVEADLRSFAPDLNVSEVKIFPLINIYDKEVHLPVE